MENLSKKLIATLLIIILVLALLMALGTVVGNMLQGMFSVSTVEVVPLENGIIGLTNGGLTPAEREQFEADSELPICNDEFRNFKIFETEKYVAIYHVTKDNLNNRIEPNITFVKTANGLVWDGCWGITATINRDWWSAWADWVNVFFNAGNNPNVKVLLDTEFNNLVTWRGLLGEVRSENFVTFSDFKPFFCTDFYNINPLLNVGREISGANYTDTLLLYNRIHEYLMKFLVIKYFEDLSGGVEFDMQSCLAHQNSDYETRKNCEDCMTETIQSFNAWATYLWQQSKSANHATLQSIVDIGYYYNKYIPEEEQINYPIPVDKQADYNGREYYPMYKCKIMAEVLYNWLSSDINRNSDVIESNTRDEVINELPEPIIQYSLLKVVLANPEDSDISMFDISANPVIFEFYNEDIDFVSSLVIDNNNKFIDHQNCSSAIPMGETIYYNIYSDGLVFESYSGSIIVDKSVNVMYFNYTYVHGFVGVQVSIAQISSVPSDFIDLETFPVRIILTGNNDEGTYQFVFNNNSLLDTVLGENIPIGNYTYTVLSEQLIFGSTTGNIDITAMDRVFVFNYSVNVYEDDLMFTIDVVITDIPSGANDIAIYATVDTVQLLSDKLSDDRYNVFVKIFDDDGYILFNKSHVHAGYNSTCSDLWNSNGVLTAGVEYTGQLIYASNENDKSYVSGTFKFTYEINKKFTFTYLCVEV